jgi:hypothetical protein
MHIGGCNGFFIIDLLLFATEEEGSHMHIRRFALETVMHIIIIMYYKFVGDKRRDGLLMMRKYRK